MQSLLRGGGGGSDNNKLQKICSKSNSITFYRSVGMRNQVEKERYQGTSNQENSMQYLLRGGPGGGAENNELPKICTKSNSITCNL